MKLTIIAILILFVSAGSVFCDPGELELKVFETRHRDAASLLPVAEGLKSAEGKVSIDIHSDSLIVVDHPANLKNIANALAVLDAPQKQIEIDVLVTEVTGKFLKEAGITLSRGIIPPEELKKINYLLQTSEDAAVRSRVSVRTISGRPASLKVTQEEIFGGTATYHQGVVTIVPLTERSAGKFLEVLPKVNGDGSITVIIRPTVSEFQEDRSIYERAILTQVIVDPGDTIVLGGLETAEERTRQAGLSATKMAVSGSLEEDKKIVMFLTATTIEK